MSHGEFRVDPDGLRKAARRVHAWTDGLDAHGSFGEGLPVLLAEVEDALDGSALTEALGATVIGLTRATDGLVDALRAVADGLDQAAARYATADENAARDLATPDR